MAWLAAVCAQTSVKPTFALLLGEWPANPSSGVDVHCVGAVAGWLVVLQAWLDRRGVGLGDEQEAWSDWRLVATPGGVGSGLVELHGDCRRHIRLKGKGGGTTAHQFVSHHLFKPLCKLKNQRLIRPTWVKSIREMSCYITSCTVYTS